MRKERWRLQSTMLVLMPLPGGDSELVQIMDAALAEVAKIAGPWLVCRAGCTQCCYGAFAISQLDELRLRAGMDALRESDPIMAAELKRRAGEWVSAHGAGFPGDIGTGLLGDTDAEHERFEEYANDAACPALNLATGMCDVYAWRPMTCRVFGPPVRMGDGDALGHCELCFADASEAQVAACEMPIPHALEATLLDGIPAKGETLVVFALLPEAYVPFLEVPPR